MMTSHSDSGTRLKTIRQAVIFIALAFLALLISLWLLKTVSSVPYIFIGVAGIVLVSLYAFLSKRNWVKAIWINLVFIILALTVFEGYRWQKSMSSIRSTQTKGSVSRHEVLGYAPNQDTEISHEKYHEEDEIYKVIYKIDNNGMRISPSVDETNLKGCVIFFGGSYTFGEGVNDDEAMPYQVGIKSEGKYRIYNFGFRGYGSHQMLASLQNKLVEGVVACDDKKVIAIFQTIPSHISRSAGLSNWDANGPKYVLDADGEAVYSGKFGEDRSLKKRILNKLKKSYIYQHLVHNDMYLNSNEASMIYISIIKASRRRFETIYPGGSFHVICWHCGNTNPKEEYDWQWTMNQLRDNGFVLHPTENIFQDYGPQYVLSPYDFHPNAKAYQVLAEYVVENILN